jgi:hypothetical protein
LSRHHSQAQNHPAVIAFTILTTFSSSVSFKPCFEFNAFSDFYNTTSVGYATAASYRTTAGYAIATRYAIIAIICTASSNTFCSPPNPPLRSRALPADTNHVF